MHPYTSIALAGLSLIGGGALLPAAQAQSTPQSAAAEAPSIMTKALHLLANKLKDIGLLSVPNAAAILNAPVLADGAGNEITASFVGDKLVFHAAADMDEAQIKQLAAEKHITPSELLVAKLGNAIGQADLLLRLSEPAAAAHVEKQALRGYGLAFEISSTNLTLKRAATFADYPEADAVLAHYMTEGNGGKLVHFNNTSHIYTPLPAGLQTISVEASTLLQTERDAEALLSDNALPQPADNLSKPLADSSAPGNSAEDKIIDTSEEFRLAIAQLTPLEDRYDTAAFREKIISLTETYARALELHEIVPTRKLDFTELDPQEATISKNWYTGPTVDAALRPEWIQYYAKTVVPKLDAFWRPLAIKVVETKESFPVRADEAGNPYVHVANGNWSEEISSIQNNEYSFFYYLVPEDPDAFAKAKPGSQVNMRFAMFCLPKAFALEFDHKADMPDATWYIYDQNKHYLGSCAYNSPKSTTARTLKRHYGNPNFKPGWGLAWLLNDNLAVRVYEGGRFCVNADKQYGGSFVSFRGSRECFPELKLEDERKEAQLRAEREERNKPGIFIWTLSILMHIVFIGWIAATPYMIYILWKEKKRKVEPLPLPDGYAVGDEIIIRDEFVQRVKDFYANLSTLTDDDGNENHIVPTSKEADKGYGLVAEMRALPDLTGDEISTINDILAILNSQTKRVRNGSILLPILAVGFAVFNVWLLHLYVWILLPVFYWLSLQCPLYKVVQPEPGWLSGLRKMLRGVGAVGALFAADLANNKYTTIYRDSYGRLYRDSNEGMYNLGFALFIYAVLLMLLPIFIIVDGLCNFLRNYILPQ